MGGIKHWTLPLSAAAARFTWWTLILELICGPVNPDNPVPWAQFKTWTTAKLWPLTLLEFNNLTRRFRNASVWWNRRITATSLLLLPWQPLPPAGRRSSRWIIILESDPAALKLQESRDAFKASETDRIWIYQLWKTHTTSLWLCFCMWSLSTAPSLPDVLRLMQLSVSLHKIYRQRN